MKSILFQPTKINQLILKNKFIMSAAADLLDNNLEKRIKRFSTLAEDDIGLIISGGMRLPAIDAWKRVVEAVHQHGGKIALQIVSAPGPGISPWSSNKDAVAVSVLSPDNVFFNSIIRYNKHHEASEEEIAQIIEDYAQAAEKIAAIGADAMQVHAAHQNFLSQFLSPITNKRTDRWGGSLENRTRLHREIIQAIRAKIGNDFPVLIKLGVEDAFEQGLKFSEGREAAEIIAQSAYDAIEVSQGLQRLNGERGDWSGTPMHENIRTLKEEAYFRPWAHEIKKITHKPVILTGGIRSYEVAEEIITNGDADLIGLCRPFIREMDLVLRWEKGDHRKATCISCNKCITEFLIKGKPLDCYLDQRLGKI